MYVKISMNILKKKIGCVPQNSLKPLFYAQKVKLVQRKGGEEGVLVEGA